MATRRQLLKGAVVAGGAGVFAAGFGETASRAARGWWVGRRPAHPIYGDALPPEAAVDAWGAIAPAPGVRIAHTVCHGCTTLCGVRVVLDQASGEVLRALGNPYHPLSADPALPARTPVRESFRAFTPAGQASRGVMCARGNAAFQKLTDPRRLTGVLKRAGPRGSGRWETIPFEQAIREIVEGGRLFAAIGEDREVPGLRAVHDAAGPVDPQSPELGPATNQLAIIAAFDDGRLDLVRRFARAFGTVNVAAHRGTCGLTLRGGYSSFLDDWQRQPHLKPDYASCEFVLFFGTSPGNAGNPFKRQAQLLAAGRTHGALRYAVVDPVQHNTDALATGDRCRWIPIRPGTDAALALGMARVIFDEERYDARYLGLPHPGAAAEAGEPSCSGATWLVVVEPGHPREGALLRADEAGLGAGDGWVVIDAATRRPTRHDACAAGDLFFDGVLPVAGAPVHVRTTLALYRASARSHTLEEYAAACGVPSSTIAELARELTAHGKRAAVDAHGGTMHAGGFHAAFAAVALNGLVGNLSWRGGTGAGGGRFAAFTPGPRYDLETVRGAPKPSGMKISREHDYAATSEFARHGHPARAPWYPFGRGLQGEVLPAALDGYPYRLRALLSVDANPLYGAGGAQALVAQRLADPEHLPLFVAVDPFLNETSRLADYVFPDAVMYESWGVIGAWAGVPAKLSSTRYPVVEPPGPRTPAGDPVDADSVVIALAAALALPGFGDAAIPAADGRLLPLARPRDYYLRAFANVAYDGAAVPDATADDLALTGVDRFLRGHAGVLTPEEERKVGFVLARGGRFQDPAAVYQGDRLAKGYPRPVMFYDERIARTRASVSGRRLAGVPTWEPARAADGTPLDEAFGRAYPLRLVSYKSQTHSSMHPGTRVRELRPRNFIELGPEDAAAAGVHHGGRAVLETPGGRAEGIVRVRAGLAPGVVAVEHGFGHWALGADDRVVDGRALEGDPGRALGIASNLLTPLDPSSRGRSLLADEVTGATARQALPARVYPA